MVRLSSGPLDPAKCLLDCVTQMPDFFRRETTGDGWSRRPPREPVAELAVMRRDVAELISNGQALTVCGDNLFVDLDIAAGSLAIGARLRVGAALVEVTPKAPQRLQEVQAALRSGRLEVRQSAFNARSEPARNLLKGGRGG